MNPFQLIAENKIREAMEKGEFDNLPGQGAPLDLSEDAHFSPEVRMAYRLFKNAQKTQSDGDLARQMQALRAQAKQLSGANDTESRFKKLMRLKEA